MNLNLGEVGGSVLAVSQFTLYGDVRRGKRPSFDAAAPPEKARALYEYFVEKVRAAGLRCETGRFQETMQVELVNDGPVTIPMRVAPAPPTATPRTSPRLESESSQRQRCA